MVQNHLMQLLCLVAMEPMVSFNADEIRSKKVDVLHAVRRIPPGEVGQYACVTVRPGHTSRQKGKGVPAGR